MKGARKKHTIELPHWLGAPLFGTVGFVQRHWSNKQARRNIFYVISAIFVLHIPFGVHKIREPVYLDVCQTGTEGSYLLQLAGSENLTFTKDAELLAAIQVASGQGSIPIGKIRIKWNDTLIDLKDHPSWKRNIQVLEFQDNAANVVVARNLLYCEKKPWTPVGHISGLWGSLISWVSRPLEGIVHDGDIHREPEPLELAEAG